MVVVAKMVLRQVLSLFMLSFVLAGGYEKRLDERYVVVLSMAGTTTTTPSTLFLSLFSHSQTQCKTPQHPCYKSNIEKRVHILCSAKKKPSFTDQILDYIEGIIYSGHAPWS